MKIYNTLTKQLETFQTIHPNQVMMYACGPTVYNYIHIGNARPIIVFDCLRRYLEYRGYQVNFVQNFTDIDDKIILKAQEEGKSAQEIAERYIQEYETDAKGLNVQPASLHPRVTQCMPQIIQIVQKLVDNGYAYPANGDVYFRTKKFQQYGKLSHMPLEDLEAGTRVEINQTKEDPMDFAVWKASKPSEPAWDSPWGKGRPGWHIECSAMATYYLAPTIDLHCGGQDLIFPHHENEIAQSECATGVAFAHYWMHNGYINVDNRKMSKSLGNFFTVREVANQYGYAPIRFMMLQAHYRTPINYSIQVIEQCKASLERLENFKSNLKFAIQNAPEGEITQEQRQQIDQFRNKFIAAMDRDFNTADGITAIFELVREMNPYASGSQPTVSGHLSYCLDVFEELTHVLGIVSSSQEQQQIPQHVIDLFEQRKQARKQKDFSLADRLRDEIAQEGYLVEETRQGSRLIPMPKE